MFEVAKLWWPHFLSFVVLEYTARATPHKICYNNPGFFVFILATTVRKDNFVVKKAIVTCLGQHQDS